MSIPSSTTFLITSKNAVLSSPSFSTGALSKWTYYETQRVSRVSMSHRSV
jgi:hypothetical protein